MKYTSILASALGLMALAACTNNDEVTIEQPEVAKDITINVTYGKGADTRMTLSEFSATEGIKASWTKNDEIGIITDGMTNPISFIADESGQTAKFRLVGGTEPENGKTYKVAYPPVYLTDGFNLSQQTGLYSDLVEVDGVAAVGEAKFVDGKFESDVTLSPLCSILVIPEGTEIPVSTEVVGQYDQSKITVINDKGVDEEIEIGYDAKKGEVVKGKITVGKESNPGLFRMDEQSKVYAAQDIYIALPILTPEYIQKVVLELKCNAKEGNKVVENGFNIVTNNNGTVPQIYPGHVYTIKKENLEFKYSNEYTPA